VDEISSYKEVPYDIILGLDLLAELEMILDFGKRTIKWGENEMEMLPQGTITNKQHLETIYQATQEPTVLQEAEERQSRILDADYSKVEMEEYVSSLDHLNSNEQIELLATLEKFPSLFGGGLGSLNIEPI